MLDRDKEKFDRQFARLERKLPASAARMLRWLRQPSSRWVRLPAGLMLVLGGVFSILPLLGLWMAPLGFLLLAQDLPVLRGPTRRALVWIERRWVGRTRRRRRQRP